MRLGSRSQGDRTPAGGAADDLDLRHILRMFWRRRRLIMGSIVLATTLGLVLGLRDVPTYKAQALLAIDPRKVQVTRSEAVVDDLTADQQTLETQISILQSRRHASRVVEAMELDTVAAFGATNEASPATVLWRHFGEPVWARFVEPRIVSSGNALEPQETPAASKDESPQHSATDRFLRHLEVEAVGSSRVIAISFEALDPQLAASAANAVASLYVEDQIEARRGTTERAASWLEQRVEELAREVFSADAELERFRAEHELLDVRGGTLFIERLADLDAELTEVRGNRAELEARLDLVRELRAEPDALDAIADLGESRLLERLREQEADLLRQEAQLRAQLGLRHPRILDLAADKRRLADKIASEVERVIRQLENRLTVVVNRERALRSALDEAKTQSTSLGEAQVRLRELERTAEMARRQHGELQERYHETRDQLELIAPEVEIISEATVPTAPSSLGLGSFLIIGFTGGAFLGVIGTLLLERFDTGIRSFGEVERTLGLTCLGMTPRQSELDRSEGVTRHLEQAPNSIYAESIRQVRVALRQAHLDDPPKTVLVTSSLAHEGKTTLAISLALTSAQAGHRTLLVDGDLRHPMVARRMGLRTRRAGIAEVLSDEVTFVDALIRLKDSGLDVLPGVSRPRTPAEMIESRRMAELLDNARWRYDFVVIDTPPVMLVSDPRILAPRCDTTLMAIRWERTSRNAALNAVTLLRQAAAPLAGAVLVQVDIRRHAEYGYDDFGSYYREYSRYYSDRP